MTIGSAKTALMAATGIQTRAGRGPAGTGPRRRSSGGAFPPAAATGPAATAAEASTGTKSRKAAWPWIRNQPGQRRQPAVLGAPGRAEAIATTNAR